MEYQWPGNVRQLENMIKRMVVLGSEAPILTELRQPVQGVAARASAPIAAPLLAQFAASAAAPGAAVSAGSLPARCRLIGHALRPRTATPSRGHSMCGRADRGRRKRVAEGHRPRGRARGRAGADPAHADPHAVEPEGGRRDPRHQLQGAALQDQGERPRQGLVETSATETVRLRAHVTTVERELRIEWLSSPADLQSVEMAWRDLETAVAHRTHVSTFDFLVHLVQALRRGLWRHAAHRTGVAWDRSEGLAPLTVRRGRLGRVPVTRIDFAPNDSIAGELLVRDDASRVVPALLDSLVRTVRFDVICLNGFEPESPQLQAVQTVARGSRLSTELEEHAYAIVDLSQGYGHYWATLTGNMRRKVNQRTRRLEAMGAAVDGVLLASSDDLEERIRRMIAINEAELQAPGAAPCHPPSRVPRRNHSQVRRAKHAEPSDPVDRRARRRLHSGRHRARLFLRRDAGVRRSRSRPWAPECFSCSERSKRLADADVHTVISHGAHDYKRHWATAFVPQRRMYLFSQRPLAAAARLVRFRLQPLWQQAAGRLNLRIDESTN